MQIPTTFGREYNYYNLDGTPGGETHSIAFGVLAPFIVVALLVSVICLVSLWKIYEKAGYAGWKALIPVYNILILLRITGRPAWWVWLYVVGAIPLVGWAVALVVSIIVDNDLAKSFGKDTGFTVLMIFLPFVALPMLAFGDDKFHGPASDKSGTIQQ